MYVEGVGQKSGPCTATFNDLLCFTRTVTTEDLYTKFTLQCSTYRVVQGWTLMFYFIARFVYLCWRSSQHNSVVKNLSSCKISTPNEDLALYYLFVYHLTTLSLPRMCNVGTSIINEYKAVDGLRTARRNRSTLRKPAPSGILSATNPN
jgi:hypothetical protein